MTITNYFAAIVTYNPDMGWLRKNLASIAPQVGFVLIVDNHSANIDEICAAADEAYGAIGCPVEVCRNPENLGIAHALNRIMAIGKERGYRWVLTLDQDSICSPNVIEELVRFSADYAHIDVGIYAARNQDMNMKPEDQLTANTQAEEPFIAITAGSMTNIDAVLACGGFSDELFIDYVDFDICIRLRHSGYRLFNVKAAVILHELGKHRYRKIFGREFSSANHSPLRKYYIYRNYIYMYRKFRKLEPVWLRLDGRGLFRSFLLIALVEDKRFRKYLYILLGIVHGLCNRYGKLSIG